MRKFRFTALMLIMMTLLSCLTVNALTEEEISSPAAILMDAQTGKILFEKNSHEQRPCASITKVMTLILVMEALDSGKIHMDDVVTASAHAASMGGSDIWLEEGEQMTVDEMIKATAVASANDAAVALAEFVSGTEDDFVRAMNARARELGMNDTVFMNCNGLDEDGHITSAYDVALMSRELMKHKVIFDYTNIWIDYLRGGDTQIVNTNKLLKSYDGITGLKTGTTGGAGSCITATAERDGTSLIAVILGADSGTQRFKDAATLLDYGFANYETALLKLNEELYPVKVEGGMTDEVRIVCGDTGYVTLPKGKSEGLERKTDLADSLPAPVKKGQKAGALTFTLDGEKLARFDILTAEAVEEKTFGSLLGLAMQALVSL